MKHTWTMDQIAKAAGGRLSGNAEVSIVHLATDSRTLVPDSQTLFVALSGERHDGHDYLQELYEHGIRAFLVSRLPVRGSFREAGFCVVEDTLVALQALAAARRDQYGGLVAAVTGSNGKTIVKEWIYQCLDGYLTVHRSPKSYNSQVGVPLSVWMTGDSHELAVFEAGISRPGEMTRLHRIIRPEIGVFTHFGTAHEENFSTPEEKLREKLELFRNCGKVICRSDVEVGGRTLPRHLAGVDAAVATWCMEGEGDYRYQIKSRDPSGSLLEMVSPTGRHSFRLPFSDDASIENALQALTFSLEVGLPPGEALKKAAQLEPVRMRLELLRGIHGSTLINDTYNSDIGGLEAALDLMKQQDQKGGKTVVLSDLLQSGLEEHELYESIARLIRRKGVDRFIGIGPAMIRHRGRFPPESSFYSDASEFLARMDPGRFRDQTVLVKGSRNFKFERITGALQQKTHKTVLEINLNAMVQNLNNYRSTLNPQAKIMVMVKALSYGTGSVEIAGLLQFHKVDYLAVAFIDEGVDLRKAGIHLPIMVLNPDPGGFGSMVDYGLEPEIFSREGLKEFHDLLRYRGLEGYPVHIKVDTGMHRLGFAPEEAGNLVSKLGKPEFRVASVFSHLAAAGDPAHDGFTGEQVSRFEKFADFLDDHLPGTFLRHILNTAGMERFPQYQFDMVRLGIGLHGIGNREGLVPVSSFKTVISRIGKVSPGETVGYGRKGVVRQESRIATIPVGYADGLDRRLGNGTGKVWVGGTLASITGDICMDMAMIDVTGIPVREGDPVELFGQHLPVGVLAEWAGTIPYEILTGVPARVKRIYIQE